MQTSLPGPPMQRLRLVPPGKHVSASEFPISLSEPLPRKVVSGTGRPLVTSTLSLEGPMSTSIEETPASGQTASVTRSNRQPDVPPLFISPCTTSAPPVVESRRWELESGPWIRTLPSGEAGPGAAQSISAAIAAIMGRQVRCLLPAFLTGFPFVICLRATAIGKRDGASLPNIGGSKQVY